MPEPSDARSCPVTPVAAAGTAEGLVVAAAWADGLVRIRRPDDAGTILDLRLGADRVWALALTCEGVPAVGLPDGAAGLRIGG